MKTFCFIVRWLARIAALLVAIAFGSIIVGEITTPHSGPPTHVRDWLGIAMATCAIVGMLLAWVWELGGALLSLAALATFVVSAHLHRFGVIAALAIPGILFLIDVGLRRSLPRRPA